MIMGFYVFGKFVSYYGLCISLGIICAFFISYWICKKFNLDFNDFLMVSGVISIFSIFGAKIFYFLVSLKSIDINSLTNIKYLSYLMNSGFVFYGGLIGGLISIPLIKKFLKINTKSYISIIITMVPLIHSFGRIGCYLVGCCHGIVYNSRFSKVYKNSLFAPNNLPLFPVQLVESFFNFLIFLILIFYLLKDKDRKGEKSLEIYLVLYSFLRFFLEFYRGDLIRGKIFLISTSQMVSLFIILIIIIKCLFYKRITSFL